MTSDKPDTWTLFPPPNQMHQWHALPHDEAQQAAPIFLYLLPEMLNNPSAQRTLLVKAKFILETAPDLNLGKDIIARSLWDCMNGDMDDGESEAFTTVCEDFARSLIAYFNEPAPKAGRLQPFRPNRWIEPFLGHYHFIRGLAIRRMYWLPESCQKRLSIAADEVEDAMLKAVNEKRLEDDSLNKYLIKAGLLKQPLESEEVMLKRVEEEWHRFGYPEEEWFGYMGWKKSSSDQAEWMDICRNAYQRLNKTPKQAWHKTIRAYTFLGFEFFHAHEDDLAEQIHSKIAAYIHAPTSPFQYEIDLRPQAFWMLVLTAHRRGDIPTAFRLAQQGLDALKDIDGQFWMNVGCSTAGGNGQSVRMLLGNFVAAVRANSSLPYVSPFATKTVPPGATAAPPTPISPNTVTNPAPGNDWDVPGMMATTKWIDPGTFLMGSSQWKTWHPLTTVTLSRGFWIGRHEVRVEDWLRLMDFNPNRIQDDLQLPVECVSWFEAMEFCRELTEREKTAGRLPIGYVYRLPTEAEWEYAAKAGSTNRWSTGMTAANIGEYAWLSGNSGGRVHPVGKKLPNAWGLFDIFGNAGEWCFDRYGRLPGGEVTDPRGPSRNDTTVMERGRVSRGGDAASNPRYLNWRSCSDPSFSGELAENRGFRLVLGPDIVGE